MLKTVDEIRTQTEAAHEDYIMGKIDDASNHRMDHISIAKKDLPEFLILKLKKFGYKLNFSESYDYIEVHWGLNDYVEQLF